jgi:hypothetical protein
MYVYVYTYVHTVRLRGLREGEEGEEKKTAE